MGAPGPPGASRGRQGGSYLTEKRCFLGQKDRPSRTNLSPFSKCRENMKIPFLTFWLEPCCFGPPPRAEIGSKTTLFGLNLGLQTTPRQGPQGLPLGEPQASPRVWTLCRWGPAWQLRALIVHISGKYHYIGWYSVGGPNMGLPEHP